MAGRFATWASLSVALSLGLGGCSDTGTNAVAPPRATDRIDPPVQTSTLSVRVDAPLSILSRVLEREVPRTLWTINRHERRCVGAQRTRILGQRIRLTPDLGCDIRGTVTRQSLRISGAGDEIIVDMPIAARISANRVGGTSLHESATGAARVQARIRLSLGADWRPVARVRLRYGWTRAPGIDFLGNRITFTDEADAALRPVVRQLEREIAAELGRLNLRGEAERAWRGSFAVVPLNSDRPPVWLRIVPRSLSVGGYRVTGNRLSLDLGMAAVTQTFVGAAPVVDAPSALPALSPPVEGESGIRLFVPVIADYDQLEPVLARALQRRARRPFHVDRYGDVFARFDNITVYGTTGGRIAVGMAVVANRPGYPPTRAQVWATARPANDPGSVVVRFDGLDVTGTADTVRGNLALMLARSDWIRPVLAEALTQNFGRDLVSLRADIDRAIARNRFGDAEVTAQLTRIETGVLRASGQGLYLPVWAQGQASVAVRPR